MEAKQKLTGDMHNKSQPNDEVTSRNIVVSVKSPRKQNSVEIVITGPTDSDKISKTAKVTNSRKSTELVQDIAVDKSVIDTKEKAIIKTSDKIGLSVRRIQNEPGSMGKDKGKKKSALMKLKGSVHTIQVLSKLNKLKNRKRDGGTPEKSGTPSQDTLQDDLPPSRNVIWNEEIEKLQIKDEELQKVREPRPPETDRKSPVTERVTVKKLKPVSELTKPKPKLVTVAKPAPHDAAVKPMDCSGFAGPRYDDHGNVIAHSILGSYDDFQQEAIKRGDLLDLPVVRKEEAQPVAPTVKYEKRRRQQHEDTSHTDESKALRNWQLRMMERKKQQGHISKLLQKDPKDLAMNQADNYRTTQEDRYIVDRTIPAVGYGKGFRVGSEFWKQQEKFGDDLTGVHMTLTQTEKGYPPPIEHVGIPASIRNEKGWHWTPTHTRPMHYPWHKSPYLEQRKKQLKKYEEELDPHKPDFDGLEVVGTNNPNPKLPERTQSLERSLADMEAQRIPEVDEDMEGDDTQENFTSNANPSPTPIFGPAIQFAGQAARWTGDSHSFSDQVGIEARVNFEAFSGDRVTSYLTIVNNGTTSIYYDWKKRPKENPFDLVQTHVQRFYFNNSSGVVLPGETMKFPFVFKSPNAGVFHEQWQFETRPVVCGGAALLVTLRGIAFQEDKFAKQRQQLELDLKQKEAEQMVRHILGDIIGGMRAPDRPSSPIDAYITDEEIFNRLNPKLQYHHDAVQELKQLYVELVPPEEREGRYWDLSVQDLKDDIMDLDEDDERKEPFLHQLNTAVSKMSFMPQKPVHQQLYKAGYQLILEAVDNIVGQSALVRQIMGLPEKEDDFYDELNNSLTWIQGSSDAFESKQDSRGTSRRASRLSISKTPVKLLTPEDSTLTEPPQTEPITNINGASEGKGKKSGADRSKTADKKAPSAVAKEKDKGGKLSKESTKTEIKGGKTSATPAPPKPPSRGKTQGTLGDREMTRSPTTFLQSPMAHEDPVIDKKYKEKLYAQAYAIVADTIDKMEFVFDEIIRNDSSRPPLRPKH